MTLTKVINCVKAEGHHKQRLTFEQLLAIDR